MARGADGDRDDSRGAVLSRGLNFQAELPNIPVGGIRVRLNPLGKRIRRIELLPRRRVLSHRVVNGLVEFALPTLATYQMVALVYSR